MWSTKHQAPTVRRRALGSARRTVIPPTTESRASTTSTSGGSGVLPVAGSAGTSRALTGPLTVWDATRVEDGVERLRRWTDEVRGVPPLFGRVGASLDRVGVGDVLVRLPVTPELLLPGGVPTSALTALLADQALATSVIASLPDLRGVATVSATVDAIALPPASGALLAHCTAGPYAGGGLQHSSGTVHDDTGRLVARVAGWLLPTPADPAGIDRVGLVREPAATDVAAFLGVELGPSFALTARDALSNALGSLHGGTVALAVSLAAEAAVPELGLRSTALSFLRPGPREGTVQVAAEVVRRGRTTALVDVRVTDGERLLVTGRVVLG